MDSKANERTLYKAQAIIRAYARALEAEEQGGLYETIADDFAVTAKMILGGDMHLERTSTSWPMPSIRSIPRCGFATNSVRLGR